MITAVNDNTLKVWEAATGNLSLVLSVSGILHVLTHVTTNSTCTCNIYNLGVARTGKVFIDIVNKYSH